jgi:hypothetical protein
VAERGPITQSRFGCGPLRAAVRVAGLTSREPDCAGCDEKKRPKPIRAAALLEPTVSCGRVIPRCPVPRTLPHRRTACRAHRWRARCTASHGLRGHAAPACDGERVLETALEEDRAPAPTVIAPELEVVLLAGHPRHDVADNAPGVGSGRLIEDRPKDSERLPDVLGLPPAGDEREDLFGVLTRHRGRLGRTPGRRWFASTSVTGST